MAGRSLRSSEGGSASVKYSYPFWSPGGVIFWKGSHHGIKSIFRPKFHDSKHRWPPLQESNFSVWLLIGFVEAQQFLRHRSVKTTESYYATYLKTIHGISADDLSSIYASKEAVVDPTAPQP